MHYFLVLAMVRTSQLFFLSQTFLQLLGVRVRGGRKFAYSSCWNSFGGFGFLLRLSAAKSRLVSMERQTDLDLDLDLRLFRARVSKSHLSGRYRGIRDAVQKWLW